MGRKSRESKPDYYREGQELVRQGNFQEAITSFRIALRRSPMDPVIMQQLAITHTRAGMDDEALRLYRHVLDKFPGEPGAHYGTAFILLRRNDPESTALAEEHLEAFLANRPDDDEAREHIAYAERVLRSLRGEEAPEGPIEDGGAGNAR